MNLHWKEALVWSIAFFALTSMSTVTAADDSLSHCAVIEYGDECKPSDCTRGGHNVYVKNGHNDRPVRVTIEITQRTSYADPNTWSIVRNIEAGDRRPLGCNRCSYSRTIGNRTDPAFWQKTHEVIGCRVIE